MVYKSVVIKINTTQKKESIELKDSFLSYQVINICYDSNNSNYIVEHNFYTDNHLI